MDHSKYSSNVSTEAAILLGEIVESFDYENGVVKNSPSLNNKVSSFLSSSINVKSLVQIQSFCATTNDHDSLSSLNRNLTQLIKFCDNVPELHTLVKLLITEIISTHNIKIFYRCLTVDHSNIANPALDLLTSIVAFNSGSFVDEFIEHFDLTLKSLPDMMHPIKSTQRLASQGKSHLTVRHHMVDFWTTLCYNASPLTRSDLLSNYKKINSDWFKFINELDNTKLIKSVIKFIDEKILDESAFRKMTKCKLIGDFALSKIVDLYAIEDVKDVVHQLLLKITTDEEHGLVFHDNRTWFANIPTNLLSTNAVVGNGAPITIGDNKFKINNKIIYTLLTSLHPWSNASHLKLVIEVLTKIPELSAPYTTYLFHSNGSHDPKLTSFYMGQTLLLTKIIQLPIPQGFITATKSFIDSNTQINSASFYNSKILLEVICPSPLNRSSLTKGLKAKEPLIRHLTAQLISSIFQKYQKVNSLLSLGNTSIFNTLKSDVFDSINSIKLPDPSVLVGVTNECVGEEAVNKLLLLNYMKAAELYDEVLDAAVPLQLGNFNKIVGLNDDGVHSEKGKLEDIDILLLNSYMKITANGKQLKWWNLNKGAKYSTFTTFAKLPYDLKYDGIVDSLLVENVVSVLSKFLNDTLVFEDAMMKTTNIKYNQSWAIVLSLLKLDESVITHVCKILDEAIGRSVKTPYKYYDVVTKLVSDGQPRLSLFYVALCEQAKFCDESAKEGVVNWIKYLSTLLSLLGEPIEIMSSIFDEYFGSKLELTKSNFESVVNVADYSNNYETIVFTPVNKLKGKLDGLIIKSNIEIVAVLNRLETLVNSDIALNKIQEILLDLVSLYGNYIVQHTSDIEDIPLLQEKYWINYFDFESEKNEVVNTKKHFIALLLNEIFTGIWKSIVGSSYKNALSSKIEQLFLSEEINSMKVAVDYVWVLSSEQVSTLISAVKDTELVYALISHACANNIVLDNKQIISFIEGLENVDTKIVDKFGKFIESNIFSNEEIDRIVELAKKNENKELYFTILESVVSNDANSSSRITDAFEGLYKSISSTVGGFKFLQYLSVHETKLRRHLFEVSSEKINEMMESEKFNDSLNLYLQSINLYIKDTTDVEFEETLEKLIEFDQVKNVANLIFSPEMTSVIFTLYSKNPEFGIINTWLYRATLYITKVFAETTELAKSFREFLNRLTESLTTIWKHVPKSMLNSQLEVIFTRSWIRDVDVLKYCFWLVQIGSKNVIESTKLVNILTANSDNVLTKNINIEEVRFYTALITSSLYQMNIKQAASVEAMVKTVKLYKGTNSASDLVLKDLLMKMEDENKESWIQYVSNWDLVTDYIPEVVNGTIEIPSFVIDTPGISESLTVNLNKTLIENSVKYYKTEITSVSIPVLNNSFGSYYEDIAKLKEFFSVKTVDGLDCDGNLCYDVEFLLLLIVNNDDLFKIEGESVQVNIRALIDNSLFQLIICGLAHSSREIQQISSKLLGSIYFTIEEDIKSLEKRKDKHEKSESEEGSLSHGVMTFKERSAFKVLIGNLLYSIEMKRQAIASGSEENAEPIPKLFIIMLSYLTPILANPGHYLYEKAYRYILNGSKFREFEIPMYKTIMSNFIKDEHASKSFNADNEYYKYLAWILNALSKSITSDEDIKILRRNGVIETLLNLSNSPYVHESIENDIIRIFDKIVRVENGADLLIRSFGLLGFVECKENLVDQSKTKNKKLIEKYKKLLLQSVVASDCNGTDKRAREWSSDDFGNVIKRVCK